MTSAYLFSPIVLSGSDKPGARRIFKIGIEYEFRIVIRSFYSLGDLQTVFSVSSNVTVTEIVNTWTVSRPFGVTTSICMKAMFNYGVDALDTITLAPKFKNLQNCLTVSMDSAKNVPVTSLCYFYNDAKMNPVDLVTTLTNHLLFSSSTDKPIELNQFVQVFRMILQNILYCHTFASHQLLDEIAGKFYKQTLATNSSNDLFRFIKMIEKSPIRLLCEMHYVHFFLSHTEIKKLVGTFPFAVIVYSGDPTGNADGSVSAPFAERVGNTQEDSASSTELKEISLLQIHYVATYKLQQLPVTHEAIKMLATNKMCKFVGLNTKAKELLPVPVWYLNNVSETGPKKRAHFKQARPIPNTPIAALEYAKRRFRKRQRNLGRANQLEIDLKSCADILIGLMDESVANEQGKGCNSVQVDESSDSEIFD